MTAEQWAFLGWEGWCKLCSWWEWRAVMDTQRRRKTFRGKAAIVKMRPHFYPNLYKEREGANAAYYQACRMALLAFCCFPNSEWATADDMLTPDIVPDEKAEELLSAFVSQERPIVLNGDDVIKKGATPGVRAPARACLSVEQVPSIVEGGLD